LGFEISTPAGNFEDCVAVDETTPLEPGAVSKKVYCAVVGLVVDSVLRLADYGFNTVP